MGATSWRYYTPYLPSAEEALQALRADVFARGDYVDPTGSMDDRIRNLHQRLGEDPASPEVQAAVDEANRLQRAIDTGDLSELPREERGFARRVGWFTRFARMLGASPPLAPGQRPRSIEELLEQAEESGTHSILDIEEVAQRPEMGVASPMSAASVRRAFGTPAPSHAQVEQHWADVAEGLDCLECRYLVVFQDGHPHEYAFIGCSGD